MNKKLLCSLIAVLFTLMMPLAAFASGGHGVDGSTLSVAFVIPFVCMLLSIALCPLIVPHFWEHHFGKVAIFWAVVFLIPFAMVYGGGVAVYELAHIVFLDYVPFIVLLFALFTVAGGIRITGSIVGKPVTNLVILLLGTLFASIMGTTGAAMLFIRPILRANSHRKYRVHTVVFFIFMVANIGGSLTPLGDPPLFLGFLRGVPFTWTLTHMIFPMIFMVTCLSIIYFILDSVLYKKEGSPMPAAENAGNGEKVGIEGKFNIVLLACIVGSVLMSGTWHPQFGFLNEAGEIAFIKNATHIGLRFPNLCRDILLLLIALVSWKTTNMDSRMKNGFSWDPILEVAKLFIGIFITMIPALAILNAGKDGALAPVVSLVTTSTGAPVPAMYFFITGTLSSFLDNAPTYLVFFTLAGGLNDLAHLMTANTNVLLAISCGAVFMGANTYIGNAPNFMVRSIAESQNVKMPSFFGYMAWSVGILVPLFIILSFLFFFAGAPFALPVAG